MMLLKLLLKALLRRMEGWERVMMMLLLLLLQLLLILQGLELRLQLFRPRSLKQSYVGSRCPNFPFVNELDLIRDWSGSNGGDGAFQKDGFFLGQTRSHFAADGEEAGGRRGVTGKGAGIWLPQGMSCAI